MTHTLLIGRAIPSASSSVTLYFQASTTRGSEGEGSLRERGGGGGEGAGGGAAAAAAAGEQARDAGVWKGGTKDEGGWGVRYERLAACRDMGRRVTLTQSGRPAWVCTLPRMRRQQASYVPHAC
jgi:hypothetical protein